ncbi:MAG TPA: hypothetical protein PKO33_09940, partial [Pyrinomonadaceae bacterium]|nr:hypothetical protein [Pyrinomonadaceae bacterium]
RATTSRIFPIHGSTTRFMGIFHGVQPKAQALKCMDCHGPQGRMDWKGLGYKDNPMKLKPPPRK